MHIPVIKLQQFKCSYCQTYLISRFYRFEWNNWDRYFYVISFIFFFLAISSFDFTVAQASPKTNFCVIYCFVELQFLPSIQTLVVMSIPGPVLECILEGMSESQKNRCLSLLFLFNCDMFISILNVCQYWKSLIVCHYHFILIVTCIYLLLLSFRGRFGGDGGMLIGL